MRRQSVACRLTALFLSVVLLCGAFPLPAAASETENDGIPSGCVVDWIQTTIRGVPSDSQLEWLRADALEKAPEGCVWRYFCNFTLSLTSYLLLIRFLILPLYLKAKT